MANEIICGDALEVLRGMPDQSIHCVVTSPPYWGLRDYGVEGQLGLEKTPEEYVERLVEVFREVRRVLRNDGILWLVIGDSYVPVNRGEKARSRKETLTGIQIGNPYADIPTRKTVIRAVAAMGLKPKDLCMIPAQVAIALRADGWWLRQDIIWAKPNPMPESVRDRCTKSHEHVFLLSKSARYYYDQDAIREPFNYPERTYNPDVSNHVTAGLKEQGNRCTSGLHDGRTQYGDPAKGRNKRDVWRVSTQPYKEAHFAVFPPDLIRPCILAGSSEKGCCPECGAPWERIVDKKSVNLSNAAKAGTVIEGKGHISSQVREGHDVRNGPTSLNKTIGWHPTCTCNGDPEQIAWDVKMGLLEYEPIPCTVLDPFFGAGTTGIVAKQEGRHYIGVELNPKYIEMARKRINRECPMERLL